MRSDGRRQCDVCKKLFAAHLHGRRKYCSDKCSMAGRSHKKECVVCRNDFVTPNRNVLTCGPACSRVFREKQRLRYLTAHKHGKARRRGVAPTAPSRGNHLDAVPNPFAGALDARERAELRVKLDYIRSVKGNHGANMGGEWSQIKRSSSK